MTYSLLQAGKSILVGNEDEIIEKIETMLDEAVGVFVMLQENTDEGKFHFYLHSDNDNDLSDETLGRLHDHYGLNVVDEKASEFAIKQLLNIEVKVAS